MSGGTRPGKTGSGCLNAPECAGRAGCDPGTERSLESARRRPQPGPYLVVAQAQVLGPMSYRYSSTLAAPSVLNRGDCMTCSRLGARTATRPLAAKSTHAPTSSELDRPLTNAS